MKRDFIMLIIIAVLGFLLSLTVMKLNEKKADYDNLVMLSDSTINDFELQIVGKDHKIAVQEQVITNRDNAIASGRVEIEELKARNLRKDATIIRLTKEVERLELEANYTTPPETITVEVDKVPVDFMKVPIDFEYNDEWTEMDGTVKLEGVTINRYAMKLEPTYYLGYQSQGFFKKPVPVVIAEDNNPFVTVTGMQNTIIQTKPPVHKRPNWYRAEGAVAVVIIREVIKFLRDE